MFIPDAPVTGSRTVVVIGGTGGLGSAIARGFRDLGDVVTASGRRAESVMRARADPANEGISFVRADARDLRQSAASLWPAGELDVLVHAAGVSRPGEEADPAVLAEVIQTNLSAPLGLSLLAQPALAARRGCVVMIASMLSFRGSGSLPAYTAGKTGLVGATRALAAAFGPVGVRVNAIAPGYHRTAMTERTWRDPQAGAAIAKRTALGRWGECADVVGPVLFLASSAAAYVTGAVLPVDGGYLIS